MLVLEILEEETEFNFFSLVLFFILGSLPTLAILISALVVKLPPSKEVEVPPSAGIARKPRISKRTLHDIAYASFMVLGLIAAWTAFWTLADPDWGVIGFLVLIPFGIPLLLASILGLGLSVVLSRDVRLITLTALSIAMLGAMNFLRLEDTPIPLVLYAAACIAIGGIWFIKYRRQYDELQMGKISKKYTFCLVLFVSALLLSARLLTAEYVELSDYFAVRQAGWLFVSDYQEIFARENKKDEFKLIGTTIPTNWDKPSSGAALEALQASLMALSTDGKTLLYRHQEQNGLFGSTKDEGIYRYRIGEGDRLLYPESELQQSWSRYDKPLPQQIMAIMGSVCTVEEKCALNADDGSLTPLAMYGSSPLHLAAYANDLDGARSALKRDSGIDEENYFGFTALEIAVKKGHDDIALLLLGQGANCRHKRGVDPSPIQLAVRLQRWRVLEALGHELDDPALLRYALPRNYDQFIADDTKDFRQEDLPRLVGMMLDAGLDPANSKEPLVLWLLDVPFGKASGSKAQLDTLKLLLDHGARADQAEPDSLDTPLHAVAGFGSWRLEDGAKPVLDLLIARMPSLDARNRKGLTALQVAMLRPEEGDAFKIALYLIEAGADDSVEYLCGDMMSPSGISIRQKLEEWHGALPKSYDCGAYR